MSFPRSVPRPISSAYYEEEADGSASAHSIAMPAGSAPLGGFSSSPIPTRGVLSNRFAAADQEGLNLSRSFACGSFVAGHSVFGRQAQAAAAATAGPRSAGRSSFEGPYAPLNRQTSGSIHLGLEPGLANPLLERHPSKHAVAPQAAAAAASSPRDAEAVSTAAAAAAAAAEAGYAGVDSYGALDGGSGAAVGGTAEAEAAAAAAEAAGDGKRGRRSTVRTDVLYGIINAIVGIPTMISFAAIVYQDATYKPLLGQLARMSFFSAAVHQLAFTIYSTLPFAVGQPQDVGLIFLSSMATGVAEIGRQEGLSEAVIVGTALLTLTFATTVVGVLTLLVAKFKLATLVQYVPLPVVGGYLGYVGYFCLAAGIGLGSSTTINTFSSWLNLLNHDSLIKFIPTIIAALLLWAAMTRSTSPWALPIMLAAVPAAFHTYLLLTGTTLAEAQDAGWVLKPEGKSTQQFWELYELFNIKDWELDGIYLPALARQIPKMLGLFFVVTFGSCLDVAAIQADMPFPIDFNSELGTVGLSNIIVGLSGSGYTGSYIFSQTIFSMRAGVSGMWHGAIIFALEAAIFLLPFSVVQYLPNFFFGALLTVFGIEIAGDWLIRSYSKVTRSEYALLLATFIAIMELELEKGVATGILLCIIFFAVTYARANMSAVTVLPSRSAAVRSYAESHVLEALAGKVATVALSGFMFFGSSVLMSNKVIQLAEDMVAASSSSDGPEAEQLPAPTGPSKDHAREAVHIPGTADTSTPSGPEGLKELRISSLAVIGQSQAVNGGASLGVDESRLAMLGKQAPCFVILDFRRVLGIDATAAQTLGSLAMVLQRMGVELILTRVTNRTIRRLLVAHGIISQRDAAPRSAAPAAAGDNQRQPLLEQQEVEDEDDGFGYCRVWDTLNEGAKYAEDRLLAMAQAAGLLEDSLTGLSLQQFMAMHCSQALLTSGVDVGLITREVAKLGVERHVPAGQRLFSFGENPETFFLILKGVVVIQVKSLSVPTSFRPLPAQLDVLEIERSFSSGQGAVVGITDFVLQRLRSFQADTTTECVLYEISRPALEVMVAEVPAVATALQAILLRDACLSEVYAYEVLERSSRA